MNDGSQIIRRFVVWWRHYPLGLYNNLSEHHLFLLAGGLSFSLFVCIVPLMLIIFSVLGSFAAKPSVIHEIEQFINRAIPYPDYATTIKEIVFTRLEEFSSFSTPAGWIGVVGLVFASTGLFSSMRTVLDTVYRVHRSGSVITGKLRDLALVVVVMITFLISILAVPSINVLKHFGENSQLIQSVSFSFVGEIIVWIGSFIIIWFSFYLLYLILPHRRMSQRTILVSSVTAAILWYLASQLFGYYISHFITLKKIYGTYTFLIVVAFWIYYTSMVFILGAEIGQLYREGKEKLKATLEGIHPGRDRF